jgi:hypothetical protein
MIVQPHGRPLGEQILFLLFVPPIGAVLWWLSSRGLATMIQKGSVSEETKERQKRRFWMLLVGVYVLGVGMFIYAHFILQQ